MNDNIINYNYFCRESISTEFIRLENYALVCLSWNVCEITINDNKAVVIAINGRTAASGSGPIEYLLVVQVSSIDCNVVGSHCMLGKHWHSNCRRYVDEGGGTPSLELLTDAKKFQLGCLISFQPPMGFQNFIQILIKFPPPPKSHRF